MKKSPGNIIILHMCTINDNHMMHGSWDIECDRQNFLSFWTIFYPFTLITQKVIILKKWETITKKHEDIILQSCTINENLMMYGSWEIKHDWKNFCHLGLFFAILPPNYSKNQNFEKLNKNPWGYNHFTEVHRK